MSTLRIETQIDTDQPAMPETVSAELAEIASVYRALAEADTLIKIN